MGTRGLIDRIFGSRGLEAARPRRSELRAGDTLDFWRVVQAEPPHHLQLLSEMKSPGDALLDFRIAPLGQSRCELQISSRFLPKGLGGISYWYAFYAFHHIIFRGMLLMSSGGNTVPERVGRVVNNYQSSGLIGRQRLYRYDGSLRNIYNRHVTGISHGSIEDRADLQADAVTQIKTLLK